MVRTPPPSCWHPWEIKQRDKGHLVERSFGVITPLNLAAKRLRSPFVFLFVLFFFVFLQSGQMLALEENRQSSEEERNIDEGDWWGLTRIRRRRGRRSRAQRCKETVRGSKRGRVRSSGMRAMTAERQARDDFHQPPTWDVPIVFWNTWNHVCATANALLIWTERPRLYQTDGTSAQAEFTQEWSTENKSRTASAVQRSRHW